MEFLQSIDAVESALVLKALLDENPALTRKAYDAAMNVVCDVDAVSIKEDVYLELHMLSVDDMNNRSGRTRYGYVEPYDAAWEMFEEALEPFVDEMKQNQKRALPLVAKIHCIGIIMGLWCFEKESASDFKGWAADAPREFVHTVVEEWKKGNPSDEDIAEVMSFVEGGRL